MKVEEFLNFDKISDVKGVIDNRKKALLELAANSPEKMDPVDVENINAFFGQGGLPERPDSVSALMKVFFLCCFTYAPLRRWLSSRNDGLIPRPDDIPRLLFSIYEEEEFLIDEKWTPENLNYLAHKIQSREGFDLNSRRFPERIIAVLLSGSIKMRQRLYGGIDVFYSELDHINRLSAEDMWRYVLDFQKGIRNVGPALICDFLKDIRCDRFVKVDHHFREEFPALIKLDRGKVLSDEGHLRLSQVISDELDISPFHLDHILYQWGRYKKYIR